MRGFWILDAGFWILVGVFCEVFHRFDDQKTLAVIWDDTRFIANNSKNELPAIAGMATGP